MANQEVPSSPEYEDYSSSKTQTKKKRVGKACDSCRIKKTKCDGKKPCGKCLSDNKICVFTEKRKSKDRHHPLGYVELLETRIDLLLKSLEKLTKLAAPHLRFLQELQVERSGNHIPINEVVSYLINKEGLLKNLPIEWENGALIAAKLPSDEEGIMKASKEFAEHSQYLDKQNVNTPNGSNNNNSNNNNGNTISSSSSSTSGNNSRPRSKDLELPLGKQQRSGQNQATNHENGYSGSLFLYTNIKQEYDDDYDKISLSNTQLPPPLLSSGASSNDTSLSLKRTTQLPDYDPPSSATSSTTYGKPAQKVAEHIPFDEEFSFGEFSPGTAVASSAVLSGGDVFSLSEYDSDAKRGRELVLPQAHVHLPLGNYEEYSPLFDDNSPKSWALNSNKNSSVTSLTNKFENHVIRSPTTTSAGFVFNGNQNSSLGQNVLTGIRRTSSVGRSFSPSSAHHQKFKNNSHVHKPTHASSHHHSNSSTAISSEFRLNRIQSSSSLSTPTPDDNHHQLGFDAPSHDYIEMTNSLPSEAFKLPLYDEDLHIMDTENMDTIMTNNPFLRS